jgi:hypothetical protein
MTRRSPLVAAFAVARIPGSPPCPRPPLWIWPAGRCPLAGDVMTPPAAGVEVAETDAGRLVFEKRRRRSRHERER